jgi:RNA polymerase sigma factor (sigma-70 family)
VTDTEHGGNGQQWVAGLIAGSASVFDAVFSAFQRRLFNYVVRMTKQRELAEDVVQDTFIRLAHHASRLRTDTNLRAWLFTVAHRLVISHARAQKVRLALTQDFMPAGNATTPFASPTEAMTQSQTQLAIERALLALPTAYREVAVLVGVEQVAIAEAATILGISNEAVRQRLSRARKLLADQLRDVIDGTEQHGSHS